MKRFFFLLSLLISFSIGHVRAEEVAATMAAGTNGSACTVNGNDGIKVGTSKAGGDMTITVPAGTTKLHFYAAAWKGVSGLSLNISGITANPNSVALLADDGVTSNSPFTLSGDANKYDITLDGVTSEKTITLTSSIAKRFVVWGATYETSSGGESGSSDPTVSADPEEVEDVAAEGVTDQTIDLTYENITGFETEVTVHPNEDGTGDLSPAWLTASVSDADDYATITYSVSANTGDARTAYIKVYTTDGDAEAETIIPVSQVKYSVPTGTFELFSGDLVEGDYVIYYNGKAMKNVVSSNRLGYLDVTPTNDVIENPDESIIWHIAPNSGSWTIYNEAVQQYAASTGAKNQATLAATATDAKSLWAVSGDETYEFVNNQNSTNKVNANLRNNDTYGFACYATTTGGALSLYKKTGAAAAVAKPSISGTNNFLTSTEVTIECETEGADIYYTTDASKKDNPSTSGWTAYNSSSKPSFSATTTIYAAATDGTNWSAVADKTFTKIATKTVAEAITAIPNQDDVVDNQYVSGIVCTEGTSVNASGQMTYYISDDGSETSRLQIYQGKNLDNTAFSAVTDLAIGDRVVVFGQLKNYKGTKEMNSGNYLVSKQDPTVAAPVFTPNGGGFMGETDVTITCATASNTIYYTLDGTTPSKSSNQYTAAIHLTETKTITAVAYVGEEHSIVVAKTFTYTSPMTVAEALTALDSESPINNAAVTGIISTAPTSNPSSGKLTYYISDDGTTTSELEVYNGYGLNGTAFSAKTDLQVGDEVTVFGNLKIFSGSSGDVKEFDTGSRLLTFSRPEVAVTGVELTESATVKVGKTVELTVTISPDNATDKAVTWQSSNTSIATVADGIVTGVAEGTATITVTTHDGSKTTTCEVTVEDAVTFSNAGYEWQHVKSDAQLVTGKYFVIASNAKGKVANRTITSGYLGEESATFADDVIAYNGFGSSKSADESNAAVFQLGGNSSDGWTLTEVTGDNTGLLGVTAVKTVAWGSGTTTWSISLEDGDATIQNGTSTYGRFLHNVNSTRFTTYTSDPSATMLLPQLYVWAEKTFKLRYDANGGENAPSATLAQNGKAIVTDAQPTKEGKIFNGWNANQAGTGTSYAAGNEVSVTDADVTIYAQWRDPEQYTISYNANGGTVMEGKTAIENETVTEGESYTVKANVYEKEGFIFGGWEYNGDVYAKGAELTVPAGDVEFVAKWNGLNVTEFVLVTNTDQLLDGDKVYIVAAGYDVAMSTQNGNIRTYVEISKSNGHVVVATNEPVEFTLGKDGDFYTFNDGTGYLCAVSSSNNNIGTQEDLDNNGKWAVKISTVEGVTSASITAQGSYTKNKLKWNNSQPRFSCYGSGQSDVAIYKKVNVLREVAAGTWGTFCPANEVKYPTGASFFTLTYKEVHAGVPYKIFFDEIGEGESLEAGKPYLFISDGDIKGVKTGSAASSSQDYNGFHGIVSSTPGVTDGKYSFTVTAEEEAAYKYYILYQGQIRLCGAGTYNIAVGRAYINMSELTGNYVAPAPGRRRVGMTNPQAPQTPTDIDAVANTCKAMKVIFNDQLLILRDGKLYDTTGRLVGNFE